MARKSQLYDMIREDKSESWTSKILTPFARLLPDSVIRKVSRQVLPSYVMSEKAQVRHPKYDPSMLWEAYTHSWVLGAISRAIKQEVTRNGWDIVERFKYKCEGCGREYQETPEGETCQTEGCTGDLRTPDTEQLIKAREMFGRFGKVNEDCSIRELLNSIIDYELALANWYLEVGYKRTEVESVEVKEPDELYVLDSRYVRPVSDEFGHLGNNEYICRKCYNKRIRLYNEKEIPHARIDNYYTLDEARNNNFRCPDCGGQLTQTAWVQEVKGEIESRWGKDEIVQGSKERVFPELFGVSKLLKLYKVVETIRQMDDYNWEVYSIGHVGGFLVLPEYDEHDIAQLQTRIKQELQNIGKRDIQSGKVRLSKKSRTVFLGSRRGAEEPSFIQTMPDLSAMQSTDYYDRYVSAISAEYGCQAIFLAMTTEERTGSTPVLQIRVQDRTTKDYQSYFETVFNEEVFDLFDISDWMFKFNVIEERDRLREAQIKQTKSATALTLVRAGFSPRFDENEELVIEGEGHYIEGDRNRMGEPREEEDAVATGVESVRPEAETRESERTGELVQRTEDVPIRLPISWYEATKIEAFGKTYAVNNDREEVFLTIDGVEVEETRTDARNFHYIIAGLIDLVLNQARTQIPDAQQQVFDILQQNWVMNLRREYSSEILQQISNYFEGSMMGELAKKVDNLRDRLDKIFPSSLEEQHVE